MRIKSLNTKHSGYNFRSRLEARWAIYFEEMGWDDYLYEPQGFALENGDKYLPDFYLPNFKTFVEVKFDVLDEFDFDKARLLVKATRIPLIILDSDPGLRHFTQLFFDEEAEEVKTVEVNLVEDPHKKGSFITNLILVDEEDYIANNFLEPIDAVRMARENRFGIFE